MATKIMFDVSMVDEPSVQESFDFLADAEQFVMDQLASAGARPARTTELMQADGPMPLHFSTNAWRWEGDVSFLRTDGTCRPDVLYITERRVLLV